MLCKAGSLDLACGWQRKRDMVQAGRTSVKNPSWMFLKLSKKTLTGTDLLHVSMSRDQLQHHVQSMKHGSVLHRPFPTTQSWENCYQALWRAKLYLGCTGRCLWANAELSYACNGNGGRRVNQRVRIEYTLLKSIPETQLSRTHSSSHSTRIRVAKLII